MFKVGDKVRVVKVDETKTCCVCGWLADFKYEDQYYCDDCILQEFDITTEEVTVYYNDEGVPIGNDNDDYLIDILQEYDENIEEI